MSTSIETKYLGPTNYRPSRIKAWARANWGGRPSPSVTMSLGVENETMHETHIKAAKLLAEKLKWEGAWAVGDTHAGIVAVRLNRGTPDMAGLQWTGFYVEEGTE